MMRPPLLVTLPASLLDRLLAECLDLALPSEWVLAAFAAALLEEARP